MSTMSDPLTPMDIDYESPTSPPTEITEAFPTSNGLHDMKENEAPNPPPHKAHMSPPPEPPKPVVDCEACKVLGNKFFKLKQYDKAIQEYTKGLSAFQK